MTIRKSLGDDQRDEEPATGGTIGSLGKVLWLTDTFGDRNGVSTVLRAIHEEICRLDLPVDILVCSAEMESTDHLVVLKPVSEFTFPMYRQQPVRIPNYLQIYRLLKKGNYQHVICSTEGPMGLAARWIGRITPVETSFFLHTDWLAFARDTLHFEKTGMNNLRRLMRLYYRGFNRIFVLNTEQQHWLSGPEMGFDPDRIKLTAHWVDGKFTGPQPTERWTFPFDGSLPVLLYAGRLSKEKGVFDLPAVFSMVSEYIPEARMVIAGTGPAEAELKSLMPGAHFTGWVDHDDLPGLYCSADLLLLPSRFDTFSCVVLESLSCGTPVIAYNTKGPRDILSEGDCGYLAETPDEMAGYAIAHFLDPERQVRLRLNAVSRSADYQAEPIIRQLLADVGIVQENQGV